jgi:hypothetical protein
MMSTARKTKRRLRVGEWVFFPYGTWPAFAQIIEDRGRLGVKGRRIYRIRLDRDPDDGGPLETEKNEDRLEPAVLDKTAVLRFLREGGLVAILQGHLVRQKEPPRAWLSFTVLGKVIHTFDRSRGIIGGAPVPYFALLEEKIYAPKKDDVVKFLTSFDLTRDESEDVVRSIGTAP